MTTSTAYLAELEATAEELDRVIAWWRCNLACDPLEVLTRPAPRPAGSAPGKWCEEHERPLGACHGDGQLCAGVDVSQWVRRDPAGEAAVADEHLTRLVWRYGRAVSRSVETLAAFVAAHQPVPPMREAEREAIRRANTLGCESCARVRDEHGEPRHVEPVGGPTDLRGLLSRPMLLCRMCRDRCVARDERGLPPCPTEAEVAERWLRWGGLRWPRGIL